ncbi:MAG: AAA family ATPase [Candidatus Hydrothermarchaeota archaeon]|nr:AAA family ATPase [Candidatus Hydrothermarchaeota archaeon]
MKYIVIGGINIQTYLDKWVASRAREVERKPVTYPQARPARLVKLKPVGFPFKDVHRSYLNIADEKLFEIYAREQWIGSTVARGDYLFDQRIIPDFAFRVIKVLPLGEVTVTGDTVIQIEKMPEEPLRIAAYKFRDVVGHEDVKRKCKIIIKYLKDPRSFGEWAPKNILFYGHPGTGKTMTAKALASETSSSLYLVRATELIGEYVGDGSKRIHELFRNASENAPSIIFIDELDAIGLDRAYQSVRGDVSEIVNALLTELEGIQENKGVVTIAATNNPALLDPALKSRFEEEMEFRLPNEKERLEILKKYIKKFPLKVAVDLKEYVKKTEGFSGRDIKEKLLKAALHKAILEDSGEVSDTHFESALKAIPSKPKPPREMFR